MFRSKQDDHRNGRGNLAARMGRWSAAHWKTATFGWLGFVLVAFALGGAVGTKSIDANAPGPGESGRMDRILDAGFEQPAGESVLVQSRTLRTTDPAFRPAITDVVSRLSKLNVVQNVRSPLDPGNTGQIAKDGHAALVEFEIRGDPDKAIDKIGPVLDTVDDLQAAHPAVFVGEFGDASKVDALVTAYGDDLEKAGMLSLPITLIILVLAFGALVAAGIPLLLALTAVFATFGLIALPSAIFPVAMQAPALVLLDRPRRRRRLLDVLLEARTRGAGRRAERAGRSRGRRGHVRPLGAHLRPDRDGRDGRDVPHRRPDLRLAGRRGDHGRRDRDAGLAHRAAGASVEAR